mgnify:CR=1 FL=1
MGIDFYLRQLQQYRVLPRKEFLKLLLQAKRGNKEAFETLVTHNLRLVVYAVKPFQRFVSFEDLIQEGNMALMKTLKLYNPRRHSQFSTYAIKAIHRYVCRKIKQENLIYLPSRIELLLYRFSQKDQVLQQQQQRLVSPQEVMAGLKLKPREELVLWHVLGVKQVFPERREEGQLRPMEELGDWQQERAVQQQFTLTHTLQQIRAKFFHVLSPDLQQILILLYGLDGQDPLTLQQAVQHFGISRDMIRRREHQALRLLRMALRNDQGSHQEVSQSYVHSNCPLSAKK